MILTLRRITHEEPIHIFTIPLTHSGSIISIYSYSQSLGCVVVEDALPILTTHIFAPCAFAWNSDQQTWSKQKSLLIVVIADEFYLVNVGCGGEDPCGSANYYNQIDAFGIVDEVVSPGKDVFR